MKMFIVQISGIRSKIFIEVILKTSQNARVSHKLSRGKSEEPKTYQNNKFKLSEIQNLLFTQNIVLVLSQSKSCKK